MHMLGMSLSVASPYRTARLAGGEYAVADIRAAFGDDVCKMPHVLRVIAENVLRESSGDRELGESLSALRGWLECGTSEAEIAFQPGRVLMHDTTCTPALVDVAAMRNAIAAAGGEPERLSPVLPVDVSVDHSLGVDLSGSGGRARTPSRLISRS
jgi:aconitate hydratase